MGSARGGAGATGCTGTIGRGAACTTGGTAGTTGGTSRTTGVAAWTTGVGVAIGAGRTAGARRAT
ncbi:MAG: spore surface glycoprotein BclB, partial [Thermoleophilia bacterium]|nr:spore surface glycoprotein BclB [Thermoleophilia bacterium]